MSELTEYLTDYYTIAVTGMCKNAGKTTVINHIIDEYYQKYRIALTSVGYDGEEKDEVTRLDKPRIEVYPGMFVGTCESCLKTADAKYRIYAKTGIKTILGEIFIVEVSAQGYIEVSGPSIVSQLKTLVDSMQDLGCEKILIDGSAGRLSFASSMDCTILSTGAAISNDMSKVIKMTEHQVSLLRITACEESHDDEAYIFHNGALVDEDLMHIIKDYRGHKKTVIVNDAASLFLSPRKYRKFLHRNGRICVKQETNIVALTINPMSPYGKWFDKRRFKERMQEHLSLPVINVMDKKVIKNEQ